MGENQKDNNKKKQIIRIILIIICFIIGFIIGTMDISTPSKESNKPTKDKYADYINKELYNETNSDSILIKSIEDGKISFTWFHGREYDNIPFKDGKATISESDEYETTMELKDNKIFVKTEPMSEEANSDLTTEEVYYKDLNAITDPGEKEINVLLSFLNYNTDLCKNQEPLERNIQLQHLSNWYGRQVVESDDDFMDYISAGFYSCYHNVDYVDVLDIGTGGHFLMTPSQYDDYQKYYNYKLRKYDDMIQNSDYYKEYSYFYEEAIPYLNQEYYIAAVHGDGYGVDGSTYEILELKNNNGKYEVSIKAKIRHEEEDSVEFIDGVEVVHEVTREYIGIFKAELVGNYLKYSPLYFAKIN